MTTTTVTSLGQAFQILGIVGGISTCEEIQAAFRRKVKSVATGAGDFTADMDEVTQAKEFLLVALEKVQEQARRDRARQQEQKERSQARERVRQQEEKAAEEERHSRQTDQEKEEEPLRLTGTSPNQEEEQAENKGGSCHEELLDQACTLLRAREAELQQVNQEEADLMQNLCRVHARRAELEQAIAQARQLASQVCEILTRSSEPAAGRGEENGNRGCPDIGGVA